MNRVKIIPPVCFLFVGIVANGIAIADTGDTQKIDATSAAITTGVETTSSTLSDVTGMSTSISRTSAADVLVIATVSVATEEPFNTARTAEYQLTDGTTPSRSLYRYLSSKNNKDIGVLALSHVFSHPGGSSVTYKLQHAVDAAKISTYGTIVALPLKTSETSPSDDITLGHGSTEVAGSTNTTATTSASYVEISDQGSGGTASEITVNLPTSGSIYAIATFNQSYETAVVTGSWTLQYKPPSGSWADVGSEVSRSVSVAADTGAISVSALVQDLTSTGNYMFRLAHKRTSGTGKVYTHNVNITAFSLAFDDGTNTGSFESYEFSSAGTTSSNATFVPSVPSIEFSLATASKFFMYSALTVTAPIEGETSFANFKQQIYQTSGTPAAVYDGSPLDRYIQSTSSSGSVSLTGISDEISTGTTNMFRLMFAEDDNSDTKDVTVDALTDGFALTSGTVFSTTTYAVLDSLSASEAKDGNVHVSWSTATELNTAGYILERWDKRAGNYLPVSNGMVTAIPYAAAGAQYSVVDDGARVGNWYSYRLVEIETNGNRRLIGPLDVKVEHSGQVVPGGASSTINSRPRQPLKVVQQRYEKAFNQNKLAAEARNNVKQTGTVARLKLKEKGLYFLSSRDIAEVFGVSEIQIGKWMRNDSLALEHRGKKVSYQPRADGLVFYAEAIDSSHTLENVYWITLNGGRQMPANPSAKTGPADPSWSYSYSEHIEVDNFAIPFASHDPEADFWYWHFLSAGGAPANIQLSSPGAAPDGQATLRVNLKGGTDMYEGLDHHVSASINNSLLGEITWDGLDSVTLETSFDQSILNDGNNTVTLTALRDSGVALSNILLDSFDLHFQRLYKAENNQLWFNSGHHPAITITGFDSADIELLDISDPLHPRHITKAKVKSGLDGSYQLSFKPTAGHDYLATTRLKTIASVEYGIEPDLLHSKNDAEYLVISPDSLLSGAESLAEYRRSRYSTRVVPLQSIYDAFNFGIADPNAIRSFLVHAAKNWHTKPRFVVLAGKGTFDAKNLYGLNSDQLPILMTATPGGLYASDARFADLTGDDGVPELALGRLPVLTNQELEAYVAKLIQYEATSTGPWSTRALMLADDPSAVIKFDFESDVVAGFLPGYFDVEPVYHEKSLSTSQTRSYLFDGLSQGTVLFNYVGHGAPGKLGDEGFLTLRDMGLLDRENTHLPIFMALSCAVGNSSFPGYDSLAETMVLHPTGGVIAAFAPTGLSQSEQAHILNQALVKYVFVPGGVTVGEALQAAISELHQKGGARYMLEIYNLFGDPAIVPRSN